LKSPTLGKIEQLAGVLGVHPLVLLTAAYMDRFTHKEVERIAARLRNELLEIVDGE
jgi:hypothetical protein